MNNRPINNEHIINTSCQDIMMKNILELKKILDKVIFTSDPSSYLYSNFKFEDKLGHTWIIKNYGIESIKKSPYTDEMITYLRFFIACDNCGIKEHIVLHDNIIYLLKKFLIKTIINNIKNIKFKPCNEYMIDNIIL